MKRAVAAALILLAARAVAQDAPAKGEYRVRLTYRGMSGLMDCPGASGRAVGDTLTGTVRGREDSLATDGQVVYSGTLERTTNLAYCEAYRNPRGEDSPCTFRITGGGKMRAHITIQADRPGAYIE